MFLKLKYPLNLINSTIASLTNYVTRHCDETLIEPDTETRRTVRISLPFKDQKSADAVRKQLKDFSKKIETELQPVYTSPKIDDKFKLQEEKPALVNHQCFVYIIFVVICAMQIISLILHAIFINAYKNIEPLLLASTKMKSTLLRPLS